MDKLAQEAISQLEAAVTSCRNTTNETPCMLLCVEMGNLLGYDGDDEIEALRAGIAVTEPFFQDVVEGRVQPADDATVQPLVLGMALLAEMHWAASGGRGRQACIDVVGEREHRGKAPSSFAWVGPTDARVKLNPLENLDSTLLVFRGHRLCAHELRLCTDYVLNGDEKLHVWVEKRTFFGKGTLTLDEAMCLSHVYSFENINEKIREIGRALLSKHNTADS